MTFLRNHPDVISAMDFLVVPTVWFTLFYMWFMIGHGRRKILQANVTAHPTAARVIHWLRDAFPDEASIRFLIHDNDSIFSDRVVVIDEEHLRRLLLEYVEYENGERVHTRLRDARTGRLVEKRSSSRAQVVGLPRVGGLHHRDAWSQAA